MPPARARPAPMPPSSQATAPPRNATPTASGEREAQRSLRPGERRALRALGLPTFGLALSITVVSTYLPKVAREFTSSTTTIGLIVGAEGFMALWLPLIVGSWSDELRTRMGGRLPFLIAGVPVAVAALALMGVIGSLLGLALVVALFFVGYFVAYEPYRALYPDLVGNAVAGRATSAQAVWRGAGTGVALVGGGLLLALGRPLPFVAAAAVLGAAVTAFLLISRRLAGFPPSQEHSTVPGGARGVARDLLELLRTRPKLRAFLVANALWELSLAAMKTFVVLYITEGLGTSLRTAALVIGAGALLVLLSASLAGKVADRLGRARVMLVALCIYGAGLLVPFAVTDKAVVAAALPVAVLAGGVVMTLPYALLMPLMPEHEHGMLTGFFSLTRGFGTMLGPLLAGVAVSALHGAFPATHGYQAMWLVCSLAVAVSLPFSRRLRS